MDMISYFKRIVKGPIVSKIDPPEPEPDISEPDISEPVLTILDLMKNDPSRFDVNYQEVSCSLGKVSIKDRVNKISINLRLRTLVYVEEKSGALTKHEAKAINEAARAIYRSRHDAWEAARKKAKRDVLSRAYNVEVK